VLNQKKQSQAPLSSQEGLQALDERNLEGVTGGGLADIPAAKKLFPAQTQPLLPKTLEQRANDWVESLPENPGRARGSWYRPPRPPKPSTGTTGGTPKK
jgi:hypothetical protein